MHSLRQLLADHAPLLAIDAASSRVQVGLLDADSSARWENSDDEAGIAVFRSVEKLGVDLAAVRAFVFCDGPGSILGIRTVAMALRTWCVLAPRPVFAYRSLELAAHALGDANVTLIADARRELWHAFQPGGPLRRLPAAELAGPLATPENFRRWSTVPPEVKTVSYDLAGILPRIADAPIFRETNSPDAFLHEEPSYVTWTPQIHRAPVKP